MGYRTPVAAALIVLLGTATSDRARSTDALASGSTDTVAAAPENTELASTDFSGRVDIGNGRKMYLECRGVGSPTVVLIAGLKASAGDWDIAEKGGADGFRRCRRRNAGLCL